MIKKLMFVVILIIAVLSLSSAVSATVDINDTATSDQIQKQIDDAPLGDEILFTPGATYNDVSLIISKSATIDGRGATLTANGNKSIFTLEGTNPRNFQNIIIRNFTLIGGGQDTITIRGGTNIVLEDLNLIGITNSNYAIDAREGVNGFIVNNVDITGFRDALVIGGGDNVIVSNCNFHNNRRNSVNLFNSANNINITNNNLTSSAYGIYFGGGVQSVIISRNNITHMEFQGIAITRSANSVTISNNIIRQNHIGILIKGANENNGETPIFINNTVLDGNTITNNWLIGVFLQNFPESFVGTDRIIISSTNIISDNGLGYRAQYYNKQDPVNNREITNWDREIGNSFNIVKSYFNDISNEHGNNKPSEPQIIYVEVEKPVIVEVEKPVILEKPVTVTRQVAKDVVIIPSIKASKTKIKRGKIITVSVRLKNFGKDKSNTLRVHNRYTKRTLTTILNRNSAKTLRFSVRINKRGINTIPILLNGKRIGTIRVRGL